METRTILELTALLLVIAGFTTVGITTQDDTHYCLEREIKAYCYNLSSTMKTCYTLPGKVGGKRCIEEWKEIPFIIEDIPDYEVNKGDWICPPSPAKCYPK